MSNPAQPALRPFVENRRWRIGEILFATLHVVGSNNNYGFDAASDEEHRDRMRAVLAWMDGTFAEAKSQRRGSGGAVVPGRPAVRDPLSVPQRVQRFIVALEREAQDFAKPVLIVHGDSHVLKIDRPLRTPENRIVTNLVRLVVPGAYSIEGVLVTVDPAAEPPFAFARVPGGEPLKTPVGRIMSAFELDKRLERRQRAGRRPAALDGAADE